MRKTVFIWIILFISLTSFSCKRNSSSEKVKQPQKVVSIKEKKEVYSINKLQGIWTEDINENALFSIVGDSLEYVENQEIYYGIKLLGDTLLIEGDVPVKCSILKLSKDSLWYTDEFSDEITKLVKIE